MNVALFLNAVEAQFRRVGLKSHAHLGVNLGNLAGDGYRSHRFWRTASDALPLEGLVESIEKEAFPWFMYFQDSRALLQALLREDKDAQPMALLAEQRFGVGISLAADLGDRTAARLCAERLRAFDASGRSQLVEADRQRYRELVARVEKELRATREG